MNGWVILGAVVIGLVVLAGLGLRAIVRRFEDPCEDCHETKGGRMRYVDDVTVGGERHSRWRCDRCPNEVLYPAPKVEATI